MRPVGAASTTQAGELTGVTIIALRSYLVSEYSDDWLLAVLDQHRRPSLTQQLVDDFLDPNLRLNDVLPEEVLLGVIHAVTEATALSVDDVVTAFGQYLLSWLVDNSGYEEAIFRVSPSFLGFVRCLNQLLVQMYVALGNRRPSLPEAQITAVTPCSFAVGTFVLPSETPLRNAILLAMYKGILVGAAVRIYGIDISFSDLQVTTLSTGRLYQSCTVTVPEQQLPGGASLLSIVDAHGMALPPSGNMMGLDPENFNKLNPFHFVLDLDFRVLQAGECLKRVLPEISKPGVDIRDVLTFRFPKVAWSLDCLRGVLENDLSVKVALSSISGGVDLWGGLHRIRQMRRVDELRLEDGEEALVFLGSPFVNSIEDMERLGLYLSNFPPHEMAPDHMLMAASKAARQEVALQQAERDRCMLKETLAEALASQEEQARQGQVNVESAGHAVLRVLDHLLMGADVDTQQVLAARAALLKGGNNVWKPIEIDWSQAQVKDKEVNESLAKLLGAGGSSDGETMPALSEHPLQIGSSPRGSQQGVDSSVHHSSSAHLQRVKAVSLVGRHRTQQSSLWSAPTSCGGFDGDESRQGKAEAIAAGAAALGTERRGACPQEEDQMPGPSQELREPSVTLERKSHPEPATPSPSCTAWLQSLFGSTQRRAKVYRKSSSTSPNCMTSASERCSRREPSRTTRPTDASRPSDATARPTDTTSPTVLSSGTQTIDLSHDSPCGPLALFTRASALEQKAVGASALALPGNASLRAAGETDANPLAPLGPVSALNGVHGLATGYAASAAIISVPLAAPRPWLGAPLKRGSDGAGTKGELSVHDRSLKLLQQPKDEAVAVMSQVDEWQFDSFALERVTNGRPLSYLSFYLLSRMDLVSKLRLNQVKLARFLMVIEDGYNDHPYHGRTHAADVLRSMHVLLTRGAVLSALGRHSAGAPQVKSLTEPCDDTVEDTSLALLTCYLSAIIHDFEHRGVNNDFLIHSGDPLALLYNDVSPLENHHVSAAFTLMRQERFAFMASLPKQLRSRLRKDAVDLVLATDMKQHFAITSSFTLRFGQAWRPSEKGTSSASGDTRTMRKLLSGNSDRSISNVSGNDNSSTIGPEPWDRETEVLVLKMALKAADLGHLTSHPEVHKLWVARLEEELFRQGDRERALGQPISPLMDRSKAGIQKSQCGFFKVVAMPMFQSVAHVFPHARALMSNLEVNLAWWREVEAAQAAQAQQAIAGPSVSCDGARPDAGTSSSSPLKHGATSPLDGCTLGSTA